MAEERRSTYMDGLRAGAPWNSSPLNAPRPWDNPIFTQGYQDATKSATPLHGASSRRLVGGPRGSKLRIGLITIGVLTGLLVALSDHQAHMNTYLLYATLGGLVGAFLLPLMALAAVVALLYGGWVVMDGFRAPRAVAERVAVRPEPVGNPYPVGSRGHQVYEFAEQLRHRQISPRNQAGSKAPPGRTRPR